MSQKPILNAIVFGETGAGKSSVVNMILGSDKAKVADSAVGQTFKTTVYPVVLDGKTYNLHDTVGFGEHSGGTADSVKAAGNLYRLVTSLSNSGGVNLLVFVVRNGRLTEDRHKNYRLFHEGFCESKVPIVVVVTGCETVEPPMDSWWINNASSFERAGMSFNGYACVCAFKGTAAAGYRDKDLVEQSAVVVKQLVIRHCMSDGWKQKPIVWVKAVIGSLMNLFRSTPVPGVYTELYRRLIDVVSSSEAGQIIQEITQHYSPNVIVFGDNGVGKSSVINLILGGDKANADPRNLAQPLQNVVCKGEINTETYNFHDTMGLGGQTRDADSARATRSLYRLVGELSNAGGINLLVYVVKCNKQSAKTLRKNYSLMYHGLCDSGVPIVMVVTGCENVKPTAENWWIENEPALTRVGMSFDGHACVCAKKGGDGGYDEAVRQLIFQHSLSEGWKQKPIGLPQPYVANRLGWNTVPAVYQNHYDRLKTTFSAKEAKSIIEAISTTGE